MFLRGYDINMNDKTGASGPVYAHLPMILGPDGTKLSKRHEAVSVLHYREEGYMPEALLNYLARLGWPHGDQEIFSLKEMRTLFDINDVNKSASAINPEKLAWINQQHLMRLPASRIAVELRSQFERLGVDIAHGPPLETIVEAQCERSKTLKRNGAGQPILLRGARKLRSDPGAHGGRWSGTRQGRIATARCRVGRWRIAADRPDTRHPGPRADSFAARPGDRLCKPLILRGIFRRIRPL
jgi:hypothetical protein